MENMIENYVDKVISNGLEKDYWFMTKQTMTDFYFILTIARVADSYKTSKKPNENYGLYYQRYFDENEMLKQRYPKQAESENTYRNSIIAEFFGLFKREKSSYDSAVVTPAFRVLDKYIKNYEDVEKYRYIIERQIEKLCLNVNDKIQNYSDLSQVKNFPVMFLYKVLFELYKRTSKSTLYYDEFVLFLFRRQKYADWEETVDLILEYRKSSLSDEYKQKINKIINDVTASNIRFDTLLGTLSNIKYEKKQGKNYYEIKDSTQAYRYIENAIELFEHSKYSHDLPLHDLQDFLQSDRYFLGYIDVAFVQENIEGDNNEPYAKHETSCAFDKQDQDANKFNVYGMHITKQNSALSEENSHICIGWSGLGDLSSVETKEDLKELYSSKYPNSSSKKRGADVSQIWMFKDEIKIGDYVIYFENGNSHIGRVISDYYYDELTSKQDGDYVNNRKVEWIRHYQNKMLPNEYIRTATTQKSIWHLTITHKSLIEDILNEKEIEKDEFDDDIDELKETYVFTLNKDIQGENLIVYGTPGCGKSFYVDHNKLGKDKTTGDYIGGFEKENIIRTTFFQDYTNTDFVGQILPVIKYNQETEKDDVTYQFNPGPFALALNRAIQNPNKKVALVIEELNRGNAASIFGDIFQLLDRKEGISVYNITNVNIQKYLSDENPMYRFDNIKIPSNMFIYATMNTSDQNVFTLDTAFKRRWDFEKIKNIFLADHPYKNYYIPVMDITWEEFCNAINKAIVNTEDFLNSEDKQLGVFFVDNKCLRANSSEISLPEKRKEFAYKVFEYLWDDVTKYDHTMLFNADFKTLDDLIDKYVEYENEKNQETGVEEEKMNPDKIFKSGIFK